MTNKLRLDKIVGSATPAFRIELLGLDMETRNSYNSPFTPLTVRTSKHNSNFLLIKYYVTIPKHFQDILKIFEYNKV